MNKSIPLTDWPSEWQTENASSVEIFYIVFFPQIVSSITFILNDKYKPIWKTKRSASESVSLWLMVTFIELVCFLKLVILNIISTSYIYHLFLQDILSGQITLDSSLVSSLFSPEELHANFPGTLPGIIYYLRQGLYMQNTTGRGRMAAEEKIQNYCAEK